MKKLISFMVGLSMLMTAAQTIVLASEGTAPAAVIDQDSSGIDGNLRKLQGAWFNNVLVSSEVSPYTGDTIKYTGTQFNQNGTINPWHNGYFDAVGVESADITVSTWVEMGNFIFLNNDDRGDGLISYDSANNGFASRDFSLEVTRGGALRFYANVYYSGTTEKDSMTYTDNKSYWPMTWSDTYKYNYAVENPTGAQISKTMIDNYIKSCPKGRNRWMHVAVSSKYDSVGNRMIYNVYLNGVCVYSNIVLELSKNASIADKTPKKPVKVWLNTYGGISSELKKHARLKVYNDVLTDTQIKGIYSSEKAQFISAAEDPSFRMDFSDVSESVTVESSETSDGNYKYISSERSTESGSITLLDSIGAENSVTASVLFKPALAENALNKIFAVGSAMSVNYKKDGGISVSDSEESTILTSSEAAVGVGEWKLITVTASKAGDGYSVALYINGSKISEVQSVNLGISDFSGCNLTLFDAGSNYEQLYIRDAAAYTVKLSDGDVAELSSNIISARNSFDCAVYCSGKTISVVPYTTGEAAAEVVISNSAGGKLAVVSENGIHSGTITNDSIYDLYKIEVKGEDGAYTSKNYEYINRTLIQNIIDIDSAKNDIEMSKAIDAYALQSGLDMTDYYSLSDEMKNQVLDLLIDEDFSVESNVDVMQAVEKQKKFDSRFKSLTLQAAFKDVENDTDSVSKITSIINKYDVLGDGYIKNDKYKKDVSAGELAALAVLKKESFSLGEDTEFADMLRRLVMISVTEKSDYAAIIDIIQYYDDENIIRVDLDKYETLSDKGKADVLKAVKTADICGGDELEKYFDDKVTEIKTSEKTTSSLSSGGGGGGGGRYTVPSVSVKNDDTKIESDESLDNKNSNTSVENTVNKIFDDLNGFEWAEESINALYENGVVCGKSEGVFAPNDYVTREEFVKMIISAMNTELKNDVFGAARFEDVGDEWYQPYIYTALSEGIVTGYGENIFGVGREISREDMAVIAYRAYRNKSGAASENGTPVFGDTGDISDYALEAVYGLSKLGVMNGDENGSFMPQKFTTRAEAAKVIYVLSKLL